MFGHLKVGPDKPIQAKEFVGSFTSLFRRNLDDAAAQRLADKLGLDADAFCITASDPGQQSESMFVLRHTIMNPWVMASSGGQTYLEKYCEYLRMILLRELQDGYWQV